MSERVSIPSRTVTYLKMADKQDTGFKLIHGLWPTIAVDGELS